MENIEREMGEERVRADEERASLRGDEYYSCTIACYGTMPALVGGKFGRI